MNLLQNLEGPKSIMGRSMVLSRGVRDADVDNEEYLVTACCIIARDVIPAGFGLKSTPYPLTAST